MKRKPTKRKTVRKTQKSKPLPAEHAEKLLKARGRCGGCGLTFAAPLKVTEIAPGNLRVLCDNCLTKG